MPKLRWSLLLALVATPAVMNGSTGCGSDTADVPGDDDGGDASNGGDGGGGDFIDAIVDGSRSPGSSACADTGSACATSTECCSANCETTSGKCEAPTKGCALPGGACATGVDCCGGSCAGGACSNLQCVADNGSCAVNSDCCSQTCAPNGTGGGTCKPLGAKPTSGNPCTANSGCASGFCNNGVCAAASPICVTNGDICSNDAQCCGGSCTIAAGATVGTCGNVAGIGGTVGGPCLPAGELCSPNGTCTGASCCSRSCAPSPTSGLGVCQPESGCHLIGDLCRQTSDCCGVKDQPGSVKTFNGGLTGGAGKPSTDVQCQKAAGATFGVCNYVDTVCSAAGQICKPGNASSGGALSCSTKADCCSGNDNQYPTCQIDANGIPRCTIMSNLNCTAGAPPAGAACASSADCCGNPCIANPSGSPAFVCGTPGQCRSQGQTCTSTSDCCTGLPCAIPAGSSVGVCGGSVLTDGGVSSGPPPGSDGGVVQPPDAGGACAIYGQACGPSVPCCSPVPCTSNSATGISTCHYP